MNEITLTINGKTYKLTNQNNGNKFDLAKKEAGPNATLEQILAYYDKRAGYIQDENGKKIENGPFWQGEQTRQVANQNNLKNKSDEELMEIMRNSIDNQYVPSSIYHKAKQELEFRKLSTKQEQKEEILKLSPEFYGIGLNLRPLWKKIRSFFKNK
jgi:hypothetical protein